MPFGGKTVNGNCGDGVGAQQTNTVNVAIVNTAEASCLIPNVGFRDSEILPTKEIKQLDPGGFIASPRHPSAISMFVSKLHFGSKYRASLLMFILTSFSGKYVQSILFLNTKIATVNKQHIFMKRLYPIWGSKFNSGWSL